ncbi:hypothetical protein JVT61DRAFT_4824 [Boletus reticuloceps]|uniref:Zinc finger PHD-type domain-containing protein n=1 Tax=Boletus reticuloceps TaxID=495285 RepID=A0A8I2YLW3_9AGAM|nr:hypothetical protein JVT61DRAFT_4824 [Boletus reticuloceps]
MNSDATEAALGLLGLSPLNAPQSHPQPQPHPHHHVAHAHGPSLTSSSVGIAVDRTSTPPVFQSALPSSLVPLKRKQPSPALSSTTAAPLIPYISKDGSSAKPRQSPHPLATSSTPPIKPNRPLPSVSTKSLSAPSQRQPQQRPFSPILSGSLPPQTPPTSQLPLASPSTSQHPLALSAAPPPPDSDAISCICGLTYDDGFSIACDDCSRWCHAACFGIVQGGEVPEFWKCWVCDPTLEVDKERAVKTQKGRFKAMRMKASHGANGGTPGVTGVNGISGSLAVDEVSGGVGKPASRRKTSPGAERKSRRGSAVAAAIEGSGSSRKKRRASILSPSNPSSPSIPSTSHTSTQASSSRISHSNGNGSVASSSLPPTPVTFPPDIYPNPAVYAQLLRVAKAWRGVTAFNPPSPSPSPFIHPPSKTYNDGGYTRVDSQG